jgi:Na+/melibiose symporter-like transporter
MMNPSARNQAIAAALIMGGFGLLFFVMPPLMLWMGAYSPVAAGVFGVACVLAFFVVFWLRARHQRQKQDGV